MVVMPNHVHFVLWLDPPAVGARFNRIPNRAPATVGGRYVYDKNRPTLGQVVRTFKAVITRRIRLGGETGFGWQRNYFERIVRNDRALNAIRQYIRDNPMRWHLDRYNKDAVDQDKEQGRDLIAPFYRKMRTKRRRPPATSNRSLIT